MDSTLMTCRGCQDYVFDLQRVCRFEVVFMTVADIQEYTIDCRVKRAREDSLSGLAELEAPSTGFRIQDGGFQDRRLCRRLKRHDISSSHREMDPGPQRKSVARYRWSVVRVSNDNDGHEIGLCRRLLRTRLYRPAAWKACRGYLLVLVENDADSLVSAQRESCLSEARDRKTHGRVLRHTPLFRGPSEPGMIAISVLV